MNEKVLNAHAQEAIDRFANQLGSLLANLLTLELTMRLCIMQKQFGVTSLGKIKRLIKGNLIERDPLVNTNMLGDVINCFNKQFNRRGYRVDDKFRVLRNTITHGRIFSAEYPPMKIYNFESADKDHVKASYVNEMTDWWFIDNVNAVKSEIYKVNELYEKLIEEMRPAVPAGARPR